MNAKKLLVLLLLIFLIGINFYLYRAEFKVLIDPNDNVFQYALVDEARTIWKNIFAGKLSPFYLLDSWNERWAEGFALSNYYSHLPQAVISLIGLMSPIGMYKTFVVIRTLMLILLPLMFFWAGAILRLPSGFSLVLAFFSQAIFTDGLYGIDATSFVWRGWGLSAQLMGVFFLPPAFAYTIDYFENKKNLGKAIFFNFLVASSHFGIFSLMLLGYPLYLVIVLFGKIRINQHSSANIGYQKNSDRSDLSGLSGLPMLADASRILQDSSEILKRITLFIILTLFSLSYFIIPFFLQGQYRNFSVWDPIWKFDSWGARQITVWFLNGELFDFGRLSLITLSVVFGVFAGFAGKNKLMKYLSVLFIVYLILFFGRTTLGGLINLMPGFSEYHIHRVIVMVQFIGIFLGAWLIYGSGKLVLDRLFGRIRKRSEKSADIGYRKNSDKSDLSDLSGIRLSRFLPISSDLSESKIKFIALAFLITIGLVIVYYLEKPLINYAKDNGTWIERSNKAYLDDLPSYEKIKAKLASLPRARVYVGRPGNWGRQFTVGEAPLYMVLSQDGFPVIGFLPESWSPNSDPEQFFAENDINFYNLYNTGYSILPENIKPPDFAKLLAREGKYFLYQIDTNGWFDVGQSSIAVKSKKTDLLNITRLWFGSDLFKIRDFPLIDLSKNPPDGLRWYIEMTDKNNFINLNDGRERNIWRANPFNANVTNTARPSNIGTKVVKNQEALVNGYKAKLELKEECQNCVLVLKQSFHPNWEVKVNGERVKTFPVIPFYVGIPIEKAGSYEVSAVYKPGSLKTLLVIIEIIFLAIYLGKIFNPPSPKSPIVRSWDEKRFPLRQDFSSGQAQKLNPRP